MNTRSQQTPAPKRVLFVCTGNACRSQMGEALLRHHGGNRFEIVSGGTHPAGEVFPIALETLATMGVDHPSATSNSWHDFEGEHLDLVIFLCEHATQESPPNWNGPARRVDWSIPDPSFHIGSDSERSEFALRIARRLEAKIQGLANLDWDQPDDVIEARLQFLGDL